MKVTREAWNFVGYMRSGYIYCPYCKFNNFVITPTLSERPTRTDPEGVVRVYLWGSCIKQVCFNCKIHFLWEAPKHRGHPHWR